MEPKGDPPGGDEALLRLEHALRALAEPAMRRERLLERLEAGSTTEAYALIAAVARRPGGPAPHLHVLRETLQGLLREGGAVRPLGHALRAELYGEAAAHADAFVMRLLRAPGAAEVMEDPAAALPRTVAELPLGVRRALARGFDLAMLERLLLDADTVVIGHLLENPRVTEVHVVRIAARRPIPATTLEEIARSRRFGSRPRVRVALARNPYCPADLAIRLLGVLPRSEVQAIASDGTLHAETRRHARDELRRRSADAPDEAPA